MEFARAIEMQTAIYEKEKNSEEHKENLSFYHKNKGLALYHQGDMDGAEKQFQDAINLNPQNADNYFNLGNVHLSLEEPNFNEAHENFDESIKLDKGNAKMYHAKGLAFQAQSEYMSLKDHGKFYDPGEDDNLVEQAIEYFSKALEHCDTFISSMFHLGLMFRRTNRFHEALYQFSKV